MQSFGIELGNLIRATREKRNWLAKQLIDEAYPSTTKSTRSIDEQNKFAQQLSRLENGVSANPRPVVYRPYCNALGITSEQTEEIRAKYDSRGMLRPGGVLQLKGWPELSTDEFPETLVSFDYRNEELGVHLIRSMSKAYRATDERFTSYVNGQGVHHPGLNLKILRASLSAEKLPVKIGPKFLAYRANDVADCQLLNFAKSQKTAGGAKLFNSKKVRLSSSIKIGDKAAIYISETDYCSSLVTDQLSFQQIYHDEDPKRWVYDGLSYFIDATTSKLLPLEHANKMSNQLGASTIAFSRDGTLLLVQQTRSNAQSVGLIAPSGSGSLDWEDVGLDKDLFSIVATGAARELVEECGLDIKETEFDHTISSDVVARKFLRIFGFSRMVHRGGKPEFYCISVLPFDAFEIQEAKLAKDEKDYTQRKERSLSTIVDFNASPDVVKDSIIEVCSELIGPRDPLEIARHNHVNFLSFPLRHGLDLLIEALRGKHSEQLVQFLKRAAHEEP